MPGDKKIKDIMVGVFEYPHIPYWFSISQAIRMFKASFLDTKKYIYPMVILVFDEKYNLMGTLTLADILKGLDPRFLKTAAKTKSQEKEEKDLSHILDTLFDKESKGLAEKPVGEIKAPAKYFVEPDDSIKKAAYIMLRNDLILLPVLENKKKLVGLVRMIEVFDALSDGML
ncbi:MAG: CBS domain-containing protein [Nitrospira sp.]|nr:CBS domain-containing protein [Nitrospira sp.]